MRVLVGGVKLKIFLVKPRPFNAAFCSDGGEYRVGCKNKPKAAFLKPFNRLGGVGVKATVAFYLFKLHAVKFVK